MPFSKDVKNALKRAWWNAAERQCAREYDAYASALSTSKGQRAHKRKLLEALKRAMRDRGYPYPED